MKKLLFLFAVLLTSVGAWAQTSYTVSATTGTGVSGADYTKTWTYTVSDANPAALTLTAAGNNMKVIDEQLTLWTGTANPFTYTLQVPVNYRIVSYSFDFLKVSDYSETVTLTVDGKEYNPTMETQSVTVNNINQSSTAFKLTGANKGIKVTNFVVNVERFLIELTTDANNPKWYTIKNVRSEKYANYASDNGKMQLQPYYGEGGKFYFTGEKNADGTLFTVKIHNAKTTNLCAGISSWDENGIDWYVQLSGNTDKPGYAISSQNDLTNDDYSWNNEAGAGKQIATYKGNDIGSTWEFSSIDSDADLRTMPQMSTVDAPVLYYIRNARQHNTYANYVAAGSKLTQVTTPGPGSYWYFVAASESAPEGWVACKIYNAANVTSLKFPDGTFGDQVYYIKKHEWNGHVGFAIKRSTGTAWDGWNDENGSTIVDYDANDAGSIWWIEEAPKTADQLKSEAATAKANALNTIALYEEADYFVYTPEAFATAKNAIQNLDITSTFAASVAGMMAIGQTMTTLRGSDKNGAPVAGDYIRFKSRAYSNYLKANDANLGYTNNAAELTTLWLLEEGNDNNLKIKNVSTNEYIGQVRQSEDVLMQANTDEQFAITNQEDVFGVFKNVSGNDYAYGHSANSKLVGWERSAHATQWIISQAFPLTVTYTYKGDELSNDKITGVYVDKGETYTIVNPYSSRGYVAIESCTVNGESLDAVDGVYSFKVTSNTTVTVNLTDANLPFTVSADYENAVWYYLQLNSSGWGYVSRATTTADGGTTEADYPTDGGTRPSDDNGKWAFVGDAINGFKILNKGAGAGKYLNSASSDGSKAQMAETDQSWIVQTGNGGFAIRHKDNVNACLNDYNNYLKIWNNSGSPNGNGSAFRVFDADLTKVKEIVGEKLLYSGTGYPSAESSARTNLQEGFDKVDVTVEELYTLLDAYCQTTEIEMPVSGKAYTFTNIMNDANQTKRYMKYTSGQELSVSTDENDASVFVCHKIRDGVYAFVTSDGKVLTWFSKDDDGAYKEDAKFNGYSTYYATSYDGKSDWNEIKVTKNGTSIEDLGHLRLVGRRNKDNVSSFIVKNADETFDRAGDSYFFDNKYSSAWLLNEVTHTNTDAQSAAIAKIQAKETLKASTKVLGEGLGKYHYVVNDEEEYSVEVIDNAETADKVNEIAGTLAINLPETGKFYYIQSANTNQYLSNVKSNTLTTTEQKSVNNIFYFEGEGENTYLVAYENGHYVANPWRIGVGEEIITGTEIYKQPKSFVEGQVGKYALKYVADAGIHYFTASGSSTNQTQDKTLNDAQWNLEPVTELPLTIHSSGKSTYSAPVDLEIPGGVTVYYAKRNDGKTIRMSPLTDVIPANTGVVVAGAGETTVNFRITTDATALENNLLKPVVTAQKVTPEDGNSVFILATKESATGFYPLSTTNNIISGHKSYLEIPATQAARLSIVWDDTETGIHEAEGGEQNVEIYDLTGRRLDKPAKGVNIIGGKLVIK